MPDAGASGKALSELKTGIQQPSTGPPVVSALHAKQILLGDTLGSHSDIKRGCTMTHRAIQSPPSGYQQSSVVLLVLIRVRDMDAGTSFEYTSSRMGCIQVVKGAKGIFAYLQSLLARYVRPGGPD
eukprot:303076-Chlamydomonas_euryale.AAC.3